MFNVGDKVVMNDKYYVSEKNRGRVFTVASEPWECCGTLVIKLIGRAGGYAVDGLSPANLDGGKQNEHAKED